VSSERVTAVNDWVKLATAIVALLTALVVLVAAAVGVLPRLYEALTAWIAVATCPLLR